MKKNKLYNLILFPFIFSWIFFYQSKEGILSEDLKQCTSISADLPELLKIYYEWDGPNWINKWDLNADPSTWYGVSFNADKRVIKLDLINNALHGELFDINLPYLEELHLGENYNPQQPILYGSIPNFSNLPNLRKLVLFSHRIKDSIPDFDKVPKLIKLDIEGDSIVGGIPNFSNLANLASLYISGKGIMGSTPDFKNLTALWYLTLYSTSITGEIPDFNLPNLEYLSLRYNNLSGQIPNFNHLNKIQSIDLMSNQLVDSIPNFDKLVNLWNLNLSYNTLSGTIPSFEKLPNLHQLDLSYNNISGTLLKLNNLQNLRILDLSNNIISDNIALFNNLLQLEVLDISYNNLNGTIPMFNNLPKLSSLDLSNNTLSGNIPTFDNLPNLSELNLSSNSFIGTIPNFSSALLSDINLGTNKLTGTIPSFEKLSNLSLLDLSNNLLSGTLPDFITNDKLRTLNVSANKLTGHLPFLSEFGPFIVGLYFDNNDFEGCIDTNYLASCIKWPKLKVSFENNLKLPWKGNKKYFCGKNKQIGAFCYNGGYLDTIDSNCKCTFTGNDFWYNGMDSNCDEVQGFCSLADLDYSWNILDTFNSSGPWPLCDSYGVSQNTNWTGFYAEGGAVSVKIIVGKCFSLYSNQTRGIQAAIIADCEGKEIIDCYNKCGDSLSMFNFTLKGNLEANKKYYLFVDGCSGDICDFAIRVSGKVDYAQVGPIGKINNNPTNEIVCKQSEKYKFFVNNLGPNVRYTWTIDGDLVGIDSNVIEAILKDVGTFELCCNADYGCQGQESCVLLKVQDVLSSKQIEKNLAWNVYYSQVNSSIIIDHREISSKLENVKVFSLDGKLIDEIKAFDESGIVNINCSSYPSGLYYIQINTEKGSSSKKLFLIK